MSFGTTTADVYIRDTDGTFTTFSPGGNVEYVGVNSSRGCRDLRGHVNGHRCSPGIPLGRFRQPHDVRRTGAIGTQSGYGTWACTINKSGVIAGFWVDTNFVGHGYLRSPSSLIQSYNLPKGAGTIFGDATYINDGGMAASDSFNDSNSACTPFIRDHAGNITTFGVSGSKGAIIDGINNSGQTCGTFQGKKGITYGFLRTP